MLDSPFQRIFRFGLGYDRRPVTDDIYKEIAIFANTDVLIEKIQSLPPERLAEVHNFVDFLQLKERERALTKMTARTSAPAFAAVWGNVDDTAYDAL